MKIVKLKGGLGNQMFQYAYAKLLEELTGEPVRLDYSAYRSLDGDTIRVPRVAKFQLSIPSASDEEIKRVCKFRHTGNSLSFFYKVGILIEEKLNKKYFREHDRAYILPESIADHAYFDGYWQSYKYIDRMWDDLKKEFVPNYEVSEKTKSVKAQMERENAVFVGVRRGDYTTQAAHYGSFDSSYYQAAMAHIAQRVENPVFYIFSNDIEWCKQNIDWGEYAIIYREPEQQTDDFEELMLMASCKHAIIINSTYHWWGAWMIQNSEKIVVAPKTWFFDDKPIDIIPDGWTRI